jgi:hypothetical protein
MPVVHPYAPGAMGKGHGNDYFVADKERACVGSAKWQVTMIYLLLKDGAERAKKIVSEFKPLFKSKEEYFEYLETLQCEGDRIDYSDDGKVTIKL